MGRFTGSRMATGWSQTALADKPVDTFDPGAGARPFSLLWLHDELGEIPEALTTELAARKLRCVAPHAPQSWWVDRVCPAFNATLTPERHILDNVVPWLTSTWNVPPRGIAVAGIGMGGQGAVRLGFRHPTTFPIVASIAGAFDFHEKYGRGTPLDAMYASREHARQDTAILHVAGHDWPPHVWFACPPQSEWTRGNDRLQEKLSAIGVPHTCDLDSAVPAERQFAPMLTFILAALHRESRRLT